MILKDDLSTQYDSFVFTHIPKCGGTSLRQYMSEIALENCIDVSRVHIPGQNGLANDKNLSQLSEKDLDDLEQRQLLVLADHTLYRAAEDLGVHLPAPFYYTILREPTSRFISHYNFFCYKLGNRGYKGLPITDMSEDQFEDILTIFSNLQVRYLCNKRSGQIGRYETDLAKHNLVNGFAAFGILELMEESIKLLKVSLPTWLQSNGNISTLNSNTVKPLGDLPDEIMAEIKSRNALEYDLYQFATEIFRRRWADFLESLRHSRH